MREGLINAILRVKLEYMKKLIFHEFKVICNTEDRFNVLLLFCSLVMLEPQCNRITSLELLGTLIAGLQQKKANK